MARSRGPSQMRSKVQQTGRVNKGPFEAARGVCSGPRRRATCRVPRERREDTNAAVISRADARACRVPRARGSMSLRHSCCFSRHSRSRQEGGDVFTGVCGINQRLQVPRELGVRLPFFVVVTSPTSTRPLPRANHIPAHPPSWAWRPPPIHLHCARHESIAHLAPRHANPGTRVQPHALLHAGEGVDPGRWNLRSVSGAIVAATGTLRTLVIAEESAAIGGVADLRAARPAPGCHPACRARCPRPTRRRES